MDEAVDFWFPRPFRESHAAQKQRGEYGECPAAHSHTKSMQAYTRQHDFHLCTDNNASSLISFFTFTLSAIKMIVRALQLYCFIPKHLVAFIYFEFMLALFN
jgi:hypothetical protein